MSTIYKIIGGGGQRVLQNVQNGVPTKYQVIHDSDYIEKCGCNGQNFATSYIWSDDLERLQAWCDEWAGCPVELVEDEFRIHE